MARKHTEHTEPRAESIPEAAMESVEISSETVYEHTEISETALERTARPEEGFSEAIREGASDAREAAAGFIPAMGDLIHKGVYNGFYYLTYGVVFGSLVVSNLIPSNNAMGDGVRDGIKAARKVFEEREEPAHAAAGAAPMEEGLASA